MSTWIGKAHAEFLGFRKTRKKMQENFCNNRRFAGQKEIVFCCYLFWT